MRRRNAESSKPLEKSLWILITSAAQLYPGSAKPIIDIMAGFRGPSDAEICLPLLGELDYDDVTPEPEDDDWYYCLGRGIRNIGYHLHLVKAGSQFQEKHILFRDYLRTNQEDAERYQVLKVKLAFEYRDMREEYTDAKTEFIESIIKKAKKPV
jgi:GrpB-like predicted nucleotidyltransferase (UPF0157 family)